MKKNLHQEMTNTIVEIVFQKDNWSIPQNNEDLAKNAISGNTYKGLNQMILSFESHKRNFPQNQWVTFDQVQKNGGNIIRGEKSTIIYYWQSIFHDSHGNRLDDKGLRNLTPETLEARSITKETTLRYYNVFNISQTIGLEQSPAPLQPKVMGIQMVAF